MSFSPQNINQTIKCINLKRSKTFSPSPVPDNLGSASPTVQQCISSYYSPIHCFRIHDEQRFHKKYACLAPSNLDFLESKSITHEKQPNNITKETSKSDTSQINYYNVFGYSSSPVITLTKSLPGIREPLESKDAIEIRQLSPGCKWPSEPVNPTKSQPNTTSYLLTEFFQLQLDDGNLEPVFGSAFIYDVHSRLKVSETFHFDTNSTKIMNLFSGSMTNQQLAYRDVTSLAQTCLFRISSRYNMSNSADLRSNVTKPYLKSPSGGSTEKIGVHSNVSTNDCESNNDDDFGLEDVLLFASELTGKFTFNSCRTTCCKGGLFLIIRVEKVLQQGDVNDIIEGYNKDEKNKDKLKTTINWCCQRLGRYRMPLAWTAVDLTPYMIHPCNKFIQSQTDDIPCTKTTESINLSKQYSEFNKRNLNGGGSTRSRSVDPALHNHSEDNNVNPFDSLSSSIFGVSNSPEGFVKKAKYDWMKGMVTSHNEKRFHHNISNCSKNIEHSDSICFSPIELKISNFFRQEKDRINDDELFRHVNEIHRQTLFNHRPIISPGLGSNGISMNNHVVNNNSNNSENSNLNISNFSLNLSSAFSPTSGSVRRFKTISNISLNIRLHWATPQTLMNLLKSTNLNIEKYSISDRKDELNSQSRILLNPECLPYIGSIFQTFSNFSVNKVENNSTMFEHVPNLIREVLELPSPDLMVPFTSYRNLLYVYPRSVSLPPSKQASSRNITVRVQLMYSDSTVTKVLPAIYGKSNSPRFICDAFTTVLYHNRSPEFFDEIKIQLPGNLEENHYLLFTFYHVICQTKKLESSASLETVIGYSWLPLLEQGCLKDRDVNLLVSVEKPPPALAMIKPDIKSISEKFCMDACKWVDAHRELFNVSTTVVSSVHIQDASLECLLSACHMNRINSTIESFANRSAVRQLFSYIHKTSLHQLTAFFVPLLDGFLRLLFNCIISTISIKMNGTKSNNNSNLINDSDMEMNRPGLIALELLIVFLNRITRSFPHLNDRHGRNQLLVSYLTGPHFLTIETVLSHYFSGHPLFGVPIVSDLVNPGQIDKSLLANVILNELIRIYLFRTKLIDSQSCQTFFPSLWFLLELFTHLLAQDWHLTIEANEPNIILPPYENPCFLEDLRSFNTCLTEYMIRYVCSQNTKMLDDSTQWESYRLNNQIFSFFLYDLFSFLPIEYIFSEIKNYWNKIDQLLLDAKLNQTPSDKLLNYFKLDLLQIICSHKVFYLLNDCNDDNGNSNHLLPVNCERLLQSYEQLSLCKKYHRTKPDIKSNYIPLATIEPEFYGTEDNHHHHHCHPDDYHVKSLNINNVNVLNKHFLISLVICEFITALRSEDSDLQSRGVDVVWNILLNNEMDLERETSEENSSSQSISNLSQLTYFYSPILNITCDSLPFLVKTWHSNQFRSHHSTETEFLKPKQQFTNTTTADKVVPNSSNDPCSTVRASGRMRRIRRYAKSTKFLESVSVGNSNTKEPEKPRSPLLNEDSYVNLILNTQLDSVKPMKYITMKRLLLINVWILKYIPDSLYHEWLQQASTKERNQLLLLIFLIVDVFETHISEDDLPLKDSYPLGDIRNHSEYQVIKNESLNSSDQNTSSNDHNSTDRSFKQSPHDPPIKLKSPSADCSLCSPYVHQNNNTCSSQQYYSRPNLLKLKTKFRRSNSFSLGSHSNETDLFSSNQDFNVLRSILVSNDVIMVLCNTLDATVEGLWQSDTALGQPGLSLFTLYNYPFNCILPYKKSNSITNENNTSTSQCLVSCIIRIILYVLGSNQSSASYQRILLSLKRIISRFPSFLFEDNPEFCSVSCYHLLRLCTMKETNVRDDAVDILYFLIKNYYTLTKNLSFVKVHLYLTFNSFFTKLINSGMIISNNSLMNKHSNHKMNTENIHFTLSSTLLMKAYLIDSLHYLKHLTLSDNDSNLSTKLINNSNYDETIFDSERYIEPFNLTSSSLNNNDDGYNTVSGITTTPTTVTMTPMTVPTIPFISNIPNSNFTLQISQLVDNLKYLLNDAIRLQDTIHVVYKRQQEQSNDCFKQTVNEDTLSMIDLLHSISHRNRASPELRLYWILQIAEKHYELSQFAEASQCLAHCTAIVAEHMINRGCNPSGLSSAGCADIADAVQNLNILEESCACGFPNTSVFDKFSCSTPIILQDLSSLMPLDVSWHFTMPGFMALISWTAESFAKAGFYEIVPCLYSRLVLLLQSSNDYGRLAEIHGRIRDAYTVLNKNQNTKRMFSSYFRVGFHGVIFGELNGKDFIYKEAPFTKLAEITHRLQAFYGNKFGKDRIVIIKDSNIVDEKQLDSNKGYLQITFVEPYLEDFELRRRTTKFHCNYGLKRFVLSLPFTIDGQAHGSLSTQYKRKYILTTSRCFPYMKTRLLVVSTESHTLTPIEVALEDVTHRVEQLDRALTTEPPDVKYLQMLLQGCIGTVVNQGPVEMATTFLGHEKNKPLKSLIPDKNKSSTPLNSTTYEDIQNRLRITFQQFLIKSYEALRLNESLIGSDQTEYHKELERNFINVKRLLDPLIVIPKSSLTNGFTGMKQSDEFPLKSK